MADLRGKWALLTYAIVLFVIAIATTNLYAAPEEEAKSPPPEKKITLNLNSVPVIDAIDTLFKDSGYKYTIEPGVSGKLTIALKDVTFKHALKTLTDAAGLEYSISGARYIIRPKRKAEEPQIPVALSDPKAESAVPEQTAPREHVRRSEDDSPHYYGREYREGYHGRPISDVERVLVIVPQAPIYGGPGYRGVPNVLPHPRLIPPSLERMLTAMALLEPFMRPRLFNDQLIAYPIFPTYEYRRFDSPHFDPYR